MAAILSERQQLRILKDQAQAAAKAAEQEKLDAAESIRIAALQKKSTKRKSKSTSKRSY